MEQYLSSDVVMSTLSPGRHKIQAKRLKGSSSSSNNKKRKSLHILQPSARNQSTLVGVDGVIATNTKQKQISGKRKVLNDCNEGRPRKLSRSNEDENDSERDCKGVKKNGGKKFAIFKDQSSASEGEKVKTAEEEAYELMVQEPVTDGYWQELAEQRREALEDSLRENEQLHEEVAELKADNSRLQIMADQAEYLATVVQELMGDDEEDGKTEDQEEPKQSEDYTREDELILKPDLTETENLSAAKNSASCTSETDCSSESELNPESELKSESDSKDSSEGHDRTTGDESDSVLDDSSEDSDL